jgi:ribonuclease Z
MVKIVFLGVGSATPATPGDHVALLACTDAHTILIDAGPTVMAQLGRHGLGADDVDTLVITHTHGDHVLGWPMLLFRQTPLTVIGSSRALEVLEALALLVYPELAEQLRQWVQLRVLEPGDLWSPLDGDFVLGAARANHDSTSYAYRIDFPEIRRSLAYSGDTAPSQEVEKLACGCDLLIHEATYLYQHENMYRHSSARQAARVAAAAGCRALALVHRNRGEPEALELYEAEVRTYFDGRWWLPYAGQVCTLSTDGLRIA